MEQNDIDLSIKINNIEGQLYRDPSYIFFTENGVEKLKINLTIKNKNLDRIELVISKKDYVDVNEETTTD